MSTAYTNLGKIFLKHKEFKSAMESFQAAIQLNPFNPEVHLGLAEAYEMVGEKVAGLKEREIAKKLRTQ
jgi:cytochrome c-type biogenesis protein CcmH/NrfG